MSYRVQITILEEEGGKTRVLRRLSLSNAQAKIEEGFPTEDTGIPAMTTIGEKRGRPTSVCAAGFLEELPWLPDSLPS